MNPELKIKDIYLPDAIGIFPIAPIWWVILFALIIIFVLVFWYKGSTFRSKRKFNKQLFNNTQKALAILINEKDSFIALQKSNQILKVLMVNMHGEKETAKLYQKDWVKHLEELAEPFNFTEASKLLLTEALYQKPSEIKLSAYLFDLETWLEQCRKNYA